MIEAKSYLPHNKMRYRNGMRYNNKLTISRTKIASHVNHGIVKLNVLLKKIY